MNIIQHIHRFFSLFKPCLPWYNRLRLFFHTDTITTKGDRISMPLIITLAFFGVIFALEACGEIAARAYGERALRRYERVEHPPKKRSDTYLDRLG